MWTLGSAFQFTLAGFIHVFARAGNHLGARSGHSRSSGRLIAGASR